mmetsp:Transcript_32232/g.102520  ORF Transcript_32232/g.102520 Transcript_32232/m.102520 type:complete len:593 (-) Transcript_32232:1134-2912(-)|eukprot:CAMPEP_0118862836 /NCGR_PEP_ID=MMETSP1163-20130328/7911_1 /TAXON_ID=124430 /ORGANISM="Phaeomonas parva, Strain CCMP2877" /LENGTH=592 /DNA_ID=CAMNT_0006796779 /DNA_START=187 /DNA_END=1965 /DNA_ORIENTATION=-
MIILKCENERETLELLQRNGFDVAHDEAEFDAVKRRNVAVSIADESMSSLGIILEQESKCKHLKKALDDALLSLQKFHTQQKKLYNDFVLLRKKYDEKKAALMDIIWNYLASGVARRHMFEFIPPCNRDLVLEDGNLGDYSIDKALGSGQYATVLRGISHQSGQRVAIKTIKKDKIMSPRDLRCLNTEISLMRSLSHPGVPRLHDILQGRYEVYMIMEEGGKDLFDFFDDHPRGVPFSISKTLIAQLVSICMFTHSRGICHRDIKPENLLLKTSGDSYQLQLCDFGLGERTRPNSLLRDFCGSPGFFAPEMLRSGGYNGFAADVWSIGCVTLEIIAGHDVFNKHWMTCYDYNLLRHPTLFEEKLTETVESLPMILKTTPSDVLDVLLACLVIDPAQRASTDTIGALPWIGDEVEVPADSFEVETEYPVESPSRSRSASIIEKDNQRKLANSVSLRMRTKLPESTDTMLPPLEPNTPIASTAKKRLIGLGMGGDVSPMNSAKLSPAGSPTTAHPSKKQLPGQTFFSLSEKSALDGDGASVTSPQQPMEPKNARHASSAREIRRPRSDSQSNVAATVVDEARAVLESTESLEGA